MKSCRMWSKWLPGFLLIAAVHADHANESGQVISKLKMEGSEAPAPEPDPAAAREPLQVEAQPEVPWSQATAGHGKNLENTLMLIQKFEKKELDNSIDSPRQFALPSLTSGLNEDMALMFADERRSGKLAAQPKKAETPRKEPQKKEAKEKETRTMAPQKEEPHAGSFLDRVHKAAGVQSRASSTAPPKPRTATAPASPARKADESEAENGPVSTDETVQGLIYK